MRRRAMVMLGVWVMCLLVMATPVAAQGQYYRTLNPYVSTYNASVQAIPGFLRGMLRDQQVEIIIQQGSGNDEYVGVLTDGQSQITEFLSQAPETPTLRVTVTPGTVERLIEENSGVAVLGAIGSDIRIQGVGLGNSLRALIFRVGAAIARFFV